MAFVLNSPAFADGEAIPKTTLRHAVNDFGNLRYDGPAPLEGRERHTYRFLLAALDVEHLDLPQSVAAAELWAGAAPHYPCGGNDRHP